ncbi:MAG: metalloendopeptidase [Candidatus Cloacimonetes bacterium HGW-Cloacimonetes-1]|nr:MAG: metalloendopeptidase [Candidatus Cloacimonetes bacterium HGW-Cloacimonetes-1]
MRKLAIILILISIAISAFAEDVSDKLRELRQLESQIEKAEQKAKQTESKKKKTQAEISKTSNVKQKTDQTVITLKKDELIVRDSLKAVNERIMDAKNTIHGMNTLINGEINSLIRSTKHSSGRKIKPSNQRILRDVLYGTKRNLDVLNGYKVMMEDDFEEHKQVFSKVNRNLRLETSKSYSYDKKLKTLQKEDSKLSQEQQKLQNQINQLRKDASALESLIARLTESSDTESSSYKFSSRQIPWPVKGKIIRSFGEETKSYGTSVVNNGIDIAVPEGTTVKAVDSGEVVFADRYGGQGKLLIIDHKNGFFTVYAYNNELLVSKGQKVSKGTAIAKSGMTGSAQQPSLHFELRKDGKSVDPLRYLE